jgi:hypothetical protein
MGRRQGPAGARDIMKRLLILLLCVQLAACAHGVATVSTSTAAAGAATAGSTAVGGQVTAASGGAGAIALFALAAVMMARASSETPTGTVTYNANPFAAIDGGSRRPPPELDAGRRVHERDCSKPIADWSANLKCK